MRRISLGLKLGTRDVSAADEAARLIRDGCCQYIELFSLPDSFDETNETWRRLQQDTGTKFVVHAPHSAAGLNFSNPDAHPRNRQLAEEALRLSDALSSDMVVFHPGIDGTLDETVRQIGLLNDGRVIIENKPFWGLNNERCLGFSLESISIIMSYTRCGFCLDFGHAICASNALGVDALTFIDSFLSLQPTLFHLTDGNFLGLYDQHDHYGQGTFPLKDLVQKIPDMAMVTNEAKRSSGSSLQEFVKDATELDRLLS